MMSLMRFLRYVDTAGHSARGAGIAQRLFPQVLWEGPRDGRQVALTFDDGPHPADTPDVLEVLGRHGVSASFFHIGDRAEQHGDLVRAVAAAGHQIGLHGYVHRPFPLIPPRVLHAQLGQGQRLLASLSGRDPRSVSYVRPPFGAYLPGTLDALRSWGYRVVMGSIMPVHWFQPAAKTIRETARAVRPGAVLVLHESLGGPPVASLADMIIGELLAAGVLFVTVDEMWSLRERAGGAHA
jgi:peptidoglycan/xylan/chitin deacetylase (PgdA/CDA1 family)